MSRQPKPPQTIGQRIRALCARAGLTPSQLAAAAGISRQRVHTILSDTHVPSTATLRQIAVALGGLAPDDLLLGTSAWPGPIRRENHQLFQEVARIRKRNR